MHFEYWSTALYVGRWHEYLSIESARTQKSFVQNVDPVRRSQHHNVRRRVETLRILFIYSF